MLRFDLAQVLELQTAARNLHRETCAAGLVFPAGERDGDSMFTVHQLQQVPDAAYLERSATTASLKPAFCTELANAAKAANAGVLLAHTHIGEVPLEGFSGADNNGEQPLADYFSRRLSGASSFAMVATGQHIHARVLGDGALVKSTLVGRNLVGGQDLGAPQLAELYDRQVRAFGEGGQARLASVRVAIIGLGGTGSVVAQQLAHLGVLKFVLVDPDAIEATNLNRVAGAKLGDVGSPKVEVAAQHIASINPSAQSIAIIGDVTEDELARTLTGTDFIFCCTDSMGSRAVLNQLAYQYFIPCIDMGVGVGVGTNEGGIEYISGRVQMLSPGLPCLVCTGKLDFEQVRQDMLSDEQREADHYITGATVPQPAVMSLNSTIASAAVTMFLAAVTGIPSSARMLTYDGKLGVLKAVAMEPRVDCVACSEHGALGRGRNWALPTRRRA